MSSPLKRMIGMIVLFVAGLLVIAWLVRALEPRMAFFPWRGEDVTPAGFGIEHAPLSIGTRDGERLHGWHLPHPEPRAQVLYFHGNGGNLSIWADVFVGLWRQGFEVIAIDYRGYGLSSGSPSEEGLYRDVEATLDHVAQAGLVRRDVPMIYWGRSLGAAMAAYAAARQAPDGVVLEAGFPNVAAVLEDNPVLRLLSVFSTYRFAAADWMATVRVPVLVLHGDRDRVIPYRLGQRLYEAIPGPKRFVTVRGGDHNDPVPADAEAYWDAVRAFVDTLTRRPG